MRKIIVLMLLALITVSTYAANKFDRRAEVTHDKTSGSATTKLDKLVLDIPPSHSFLCTVTVTGQIGVGSTNISVSCAASASTCGAAADQAVGCVKSAVKAVRAIL